MTRRRFVLLVLVAIALASFVPVAVAGNGDVDFRAPLSHAQETHEVDAPGAGGMATFRVEDGMVHFRITVRNLTGPASAAHIHAPAARHEPAGVVQFLCGGDGQPLCNPTTDGELVESSFVASIQLLEWMKDGVAYVNVHTAAHGAGEVRGQILEVGSR